MPKTHSTHSIKREAGNSSADSLEPGSRRGRMHDSEGARLAILNAAEEVFAEHGFDGARIDMVAHKASYNKSLIFQYFGDKLALYGEVIRRADEQTRIMQNEALKSLLEVDAAAHPDEVRRLLAEFVGRYFDYLLEHPRIHRMYMWELAENWQTFTRILSQRDFDDVDQFAPVLAKIQQAGLLRSDVNPLLQLSPALFLTNLYLACLPLFKTLMPESDFSSPAELAHGRQFVIEFVVNGLLLSPGEGNP